MAECPQSCEWDSGGITYDLGEIRLRTYIEADRLGTGVYNVDCQ